MNAEVLGKVAETLYGRDIRIKKSNAKEQVSIDDSCVAMVDSTIGKAIICGYMWNLIL